MADKCKYIVGGQQLTEEEMKAYLLNGGIDRFMESGDLVLENYLKLEKKERTKTKSVEVLQSISKIENQLEFENELKKVFGLEDIPSEQIPSSQQERIINTGDNVVELLNKLKQKYPQYAELIDGLLKKSDKKSLQAKIEVWNPENERARAFYNSKSDKIYFDGNWENYPKSIIHEAIHAFTTWKIPEVYTNKAIGDRYRAFITEQYHKSINTGVNKEIASLIDLYKKAIRASGLADEFFGEGGLANNPDKKDIFKGEEYGKYYGFYNIHEFVAEAFTNKTFQDKLKELKIDGTSAWDKFIDFIRKLFSLNQRTLLDDVVKVGNKIISKERPKEHMGYNLDYYSNINEDALSDKIKLLIERALGNLSDEQIKDSIKKITGLSDKKINQLISEVKESVSSKYKKIKDDAKRIIEGTAIFKRFSPQEQRGIAAGGEIHAEATLLIRGLQETSGETPTPNEEQERSIEEYAKEHGIWVDNVNEKYGKANASGVESLVWFNPTGNKVTKAQNTFLYPNLQEKLDSITLQNFLFPETAVNIIGFGRNEDGSFQVIVEQPLVIGDPNKKVTKEQIDNYVIKLGFNPTENNDFASDQTLLEDLHTGNAILTPEGRIAIIDPIIRLNTPEQGYGGKRVVSNEIEYREEEKKELPKKTSPPKEPPKPPTSTTSSGEEGNIEDYEMTTSGEVNRFLSGETWEDVFGEKAEGNQNYLTQKLSDMLQDGKNMIAIAQNKWGGDVMLYGRHLFQFIQNMSNDKQLSNKKAVLMATFLGELQEAKKRSPERFDAINQLEKAVFAYYQNYMNVRGKEIVAGRLLRLYRDKYIADIYADRILEKEQVKAKKAIQEVEQKKQIDDQIVAEQEKPISQEEKSKEDKAAKKKTENAKKNQGKKKKMSSEEGKRRADDKIKDIEERLGKEGRGGLIDRIKDAIKKLNCK